MHRPGTYKVPASRCAVCEELARDRAHARADQARPPEREACNRNANAINVFRARDRAAQALLTNCPSGCGPVPQLLEPDPGIDYSNRRPVWRAHPETGCSMRIAQIAPLAECVPPQLYGGTQRILLPHRRTVRSARGDAFRLRRLANLGAVGGLRADGAQARPPAVVDALPIFSSCLRRCDVRRARSTCCTSTLIS